MAEDRAADESYRFLRSHATGALRFDEQLAALRYVIGPDGRPVAPVTLSMLNAADTVLFVPDFAEGAMQVQVTLRRLDPEGPGGALADRWRIYHGDPRDPHWASFEIDAARFRERVVDGAALLRPNPLAGDEPRLCRRINRTGREALKAVCRRFAGADVAEPLLVGVDPLGFDVRRRFDIVRVPAAQQMASADEVELVFARMSGEAVGP